MDEMKLPLGKRSDIFSKDLDESKCYSPVLLLGESIAAAADLLLLRPQLCNKLAAGEPAGQLDPADQKRSAWSLAAGRYKRLIQLAHDDVEPPVDNDDVVDPANVFKSGSTS